MTTTIQQWVGTVKGAVVATYPDWATAEEALERYEVTSIAPKEWHHDTQHEPGPWSQYNPLNPRFWWD